MKGTMKRIVSILLALALVITGLNYTPKTVSAADYSGLTYSAITNNTNSELSSTLYNSEIAVASGIATLNVKQYQNAGFSELYIACGGVSGGNFSATVNGESVTTEGTGLRIYNAADYLTYEYNVIEVFDNNGDSVVIVHCPANAGKGTYGDTPGGEEESSSEEATSADAESDSIYKDLTYIDVTNNAHADIPALLKGGQYAIASSENANFKINTFIFEGGGLKNLFIAFSGVNNGTYTINGQAPTSGGDGSVNINEATNFLTYEYNVLEINENNGKTIIVIHCPANAGKGTYEVETETEPPTEPDPEPGVETIDTVLEDAYVYNYVESGEGFGVAFDDPNEKTYTAEAGYTTTYYVVINGETITVDADNKIDLSGLGLTEDTEYEAQMYAEYVDADSNVIRTANSTVAKFVYKTTATTPKNTGLPQVYFTSTNGKDSAFAGFYNGNGGNKPKVPSVITVKNADGTVDEVDFGTANVRGNSTANAAKKPYNFKFDSKLDVQDMGKAKKWSLLADLFDKTLMRNKIGMEFQSLLESQTLPEQVYTSECTAVDLYIDGKYAGAYTLIESVEVGSTRVDINIDGIDEDTNEIIDATAATTKTINGTEYTVYDVLLELGNDVRIDEDAYYFTGTMSGGFNGKSHWAINEPEFGDDAKEVYNNDAADPDTKPEFVKLAKTFISDFETALTAGDYDVFSQYMNVDSFVDFYITSEYFMTKDVSFSSTRFYIKDGVIYAGPLWDLDLSSGNNGTNLSAENFYAQNFEWFKALMANETFKAKVIERYTELQPQIKALYMTDGKVDQEYNKIKASADANYTEAYNTKYDVTSTSTAVISNDNSITPVENGWGYGYVYGNSGFVNQLAANMSLDAVYQQCGVYGSETAYDNYEDYVTDYKTWLKDRNEWLIEQWNIETTSGLVKNSDGDVVITWDAVTGATGYAITYTPVVEASTLSLFSTPMIMAVDVDPYEFEGNVGLNPFASLVAPTAVGTEETIYVAATPTEYNFTDNGINLADNTQVTVAYTTDEVADENATYGEPTVVEEATADLSIINRVEVDGLNVTITTQVTNNGTASAENVALTLNQLDGTLVDTQTIPLIHAGNTASVTWERTEVASETAYEYTIDITADHVSSGVDYYCADESALTWLEDANLTAGLEGAKYALVGDIDGQMPSFSFTENGYQINTGGTDQGIVVKLNGEVVYENYETSALGHTITYGSLDTSASSNTINEIQIEYIDRASDMKTMTTRVMTVYIDVPAEDIPDTSNIDMTEWVEITKKGADKDSIEYSYYINKAFFDTVSQVVYGVYSPHTSQDHHKDNCLLEGDAISIIPPGYDGKMTAVWVNDVKNETGTSLVHAVGDILEVSTDLYPLEEGTTETIHKIAVTANDGTYQAFAIKVVAPTPNAVEGLVYAGTDETPYVWNWANSTDAISYEVTITDADGNKVGDTVTTTTASATFDETSAIATAADGTYTVSVVAVNSYGLKSEATSIVYKKGYSEPEYFDFAVTDITATYAALEADQTITFTATITNNGKSTSSTDGNIVMHFVTDDATGASGNELALLGGNTWEVIPAGWSLAYGESMTFTWSRTISTGFIDKGYIRVRATLEGGFANQDNDTTNNYITYVAQAPVPNVTGLTSVVNDDKTVTLSWTAPEGEGTYTYAIYDATGTKVADVTDGTTYTTAVLADGTYTYTVKTVEGNRESAGVDTDAAFIYTEPTEWTQWETGFGNVDVYGNNWYYYNGYNWNKIVTNAGAEWFGLKNTGHSYVTGDMAGKAVYEFPIDGEGDSVDYVMVNGTKYTVADNPDKLFTVGNRTYLAQDIFTLAEGEEEKVFAITVVGNNTTSYLIKVGEEETESETETPAGDIEWIAVGNSTTLEYCYVDGMALSINPNVVGTEIQLAHTGAAPTTNVLLDGEAIEYRTEGAIIYIPVSEITGTHTLTFTDYYGNNLTTVYLRNTEGESETETETDPEVELPGAVAGLVFTEVSKLLQWQTATNADSYNVYVNDVLVDNTIALSYSLESYDFSAAGTYTITVKAVNEAGEGTGATATYVVEVPATTTPESSSDDTNWIVVPESGEKLYYANATNMTVNNVQQPGWAAESGIHMFTSAVPSYIKINGVQVGAESVAIEGTGAVIYASALKAQISTIEFCNADGSVIGSVDIKNVDGEVPTTEAPTVPQPDITIDENDWVLISNNVSNTNAKAYVQSSVPATMGDAGLRGFYNGNANNWNGLNDSLLGNVPLFGFVTTGTNATGVIINGVEYTNDSGLVYFSANTVYISQEIINADFGETNYYKITATGSSVGTEGTFVVKVVGEQAPDVSNVELPADDGWTQITAGAGSADGSTWYLPTSFTVIGGDVRELENKGSDVDWGGDGNNPMTEPVLGISVNAGTLGSNPVTVWFTDDVATTPVVLTEDELYINNNVVSILQSKFAVEEGETKIFYLAFRSTNGNDTIAPVKVVGPAPTAKWSDWIGANDASGANTVEYYYATLSDNTLGINATIRELADSFMVVFDEGLTYATLDDENVAYLGAGVEIPKSSLVEGQEYILVAGNDAKKASVKIKYVRAKDYKPTGFAVSTNTNDTLTDKTDDTADIMWTPSADAVEAGYTYTLTFNGTEVTTDTVGSASVNLSNVEYGTYDVVLNTVDTEGNVVDTQTITYKYSDPYEVTNTLNVNNTLWEKFRWQTLTWNEVGAATEYAIYADGVLVGTTTDPTYNVKAYHYANDDVENGTYLYGKPGTDNEGKVLGYDADGNMVYGTIGDDGFEPITQKTTIGDHTVAVVAVFEGDTVPENYADVNAARVIGTNDFYLNLNYIYGDQDETTIWNDSGYDSVWNFTVSEVEKTNVTDGADVYVDYTNEDTVDLVIVDNGTTTADQAWTIKAAIYDEKVTGEELVYLNFDIIAPVDLVGQTIQIKCCAEEVNADGSYASENIYADKTYTFELETDADGNEYAIIHYKESFESVNDTYDLLFGLGNLEPTTLTLTEASITNVYGVTEVTATAVNGTSSATGDIFVQWLTDVPSHLTSEYSYNLVFKDADGNIVEQYADATSGTSYPGFAPGTYTVEVSSIYKDTVTRTVSTTVTVEATTTDGPDLVISNIAFVDDTVMYREGDIVPITVTMTNVGTQDAVITNGNITIWLYAKNTAGENIQIAYATVPEVDGTKTLATGESFTATINFETGSDAHSAQTYHNGDYIYSLYAVADADSTVTELNEDNNSTISKLTFYPKLEIVAFDYDVETGAVTATWPKSKDTTVVSYNMTYVDAVTGETVTVNVPASDDKSLEEICTLPEGSFFASEEVTIDVVCNDGLVYTYAHGTPLADLEIVEVAVDGPLYVGQTADLDVVIRNVGPAIAEHGEGAWLGVKLVTSGQFATKANYSLLPGETDTFTIVNAFSEDENYVITPIFNTPGVYEVMATVDDSTDGLGGGNVPEVDDYLEVDETRNNIKKFDVVVLNESSAALTLNEGTAEDGTATANVSVSWVDNNTTGENALTAVNYQITYTTEDGITKQVIVEAGLIDTPYIFTEWLQNKSDVVISAQYAEYGEEYYEIARTTAMADLTVVGEGLGIQLPLEKEGVLYVEKSYDIPIVFKNIGTAAIPACRDDLADYGFWIIENIASEDEEVIIPAYTSKGYTTAGLKPGATDQVIYENIEIAKEGTYSLTARTDYPNFDEAAAGGFIAESNEDNNEVTVSFESKFVQIREMEWTRLTSAGFAGEPAVGEDFLFNVASGSQKAYIEYKILDSTYPYLHYEDMISRYVGYAGANFTLDFDNQMTAINYTTPEGSTTTTSNTVLDFYQVADWKEFDAAGNELDPNVPTSDPGMDDDSNYWLTLENQAVTIQDTEQDAEGNITQTEIAPDPANSPTTYAGNGLNFYAGNFGLYKCYILRFSTPKVDESGNYILDEDGKLTYDVTTVALKVTDGRTRTNNWMQAMNSDESNPNTLPIHYCGGDIWATDVQWENDEKIIIDSSTNLPIVDTNGNGLADEIAAQVDNTNVCTFSNDNHGDGEIHIGHEDTEASQNYQTTGAIWYDNSDIMLSSVSVYNGNWLSVATSQYLQFNKGDDGSEPKYTIGIARAIVDPEDNNRFVGYASDFVVTNPAASTAHVGIQGTNTIHIGLPWLLQELPTHSEKSGEKDVEYYWIRICADYENIVHADPEKEQLANYIDIPITVYYDVPQIQPAQDLEAFTSYDDNDQETFTLTWNELAAEMGTYGYKYKVFYTSLDEEGKEVYTDISLRLAKQNGYAAADAEGEFYFDDPVTLVSDDELFDEVDAAMVDNVEANQIGKLRVVAYWCEQEIPRDIYVDGELATGWYKFDGAETIGIEAGQSLPVEMPAYMSYYYDRNINHASAFMGYNGYFVSLNGNTKWYGENAKVSVLKGSSTGKFTSRTEMKTVYDALYDTVEASDYDYDENVDGSDKSQDGLILAANKGNITAKEADLGLTFTEVKNDSDTGKYVAGLLQIEAKDIFSATNLVNWYLIKVETPELDAEGNETGNTRVAYVMAESIVEAGGDVAVRGFQMNTDATPGGVSEYSPSFRAVSRAAKLATDDTDQVNYQENAENMDNPGVALYTTDKVNSLVSAIVGQGTLYGVTEITGTNYGNVTLLADKSQLTANVTTENGVVVCDENGNPIVTTNTESGVYNISTTAGGILTNWSGSVNDTDKDAYTYYAVTFKPQNYTVNGLLNKYAIRAYAITENGTVIYEEDSETNNSIKSASVYSIAKSLYTNSSMTSVEDHEFLYNNVLNIVNIYNNYKTIGKQMLAKVGVTDKTSDEYKAINTGYKDLYYYAHLANAYATSSYINRGTFISKTIVDGVYNEEKLLPVLNGAKVNSTEDYKTVADWIYGELDHTNGFYEKVDYTPKTDSTVDAGAQV